ncbi:MAG: alpha-hydroxy-acid oxidizing protein [Deltaproteobacteria bacterium]|nr:alpha-hydroxy-acid oxidizing protein [Deltaproteobacteria bacterium]
MKEIRNTARSLVKGTCRVCPVCDGRVCAGEVPGMGGAGSGASFKNNIAALAALRLAPRLIHSVRQPKTDVQILGLKLSMPLIIGPIGGISFNLGGAVSEEAYQRAVVDGAAQAGIIAGLPDAVVPEVMRIGLDCAMRQGGRGIPFIKPWEPEPFEEKMDLAAKAGCSVVGSDLDSIGLITLSRMGHPVYAKNRRDLEGMADMAHRRSLKFLIKGVMAVEDARICMDAGVDGIIASNHGGRVLDHVAGTAEVLPAIASVLKGRMALLVDGGIRSGVDILKMLALGADATLIGRPYSLAAIGGGAEGVALYTGIYREQLEQAMVMTGCPDVAEAGSQLLRL